jgi:hypothetical protein
MTRALESTIRAVCWPLGLALALAVLAVCTMVAAVKR